MRTARDESPRPYRPRWCRTRALRSTRLGRTTHARPRSCRRRHGPQRAARGCDAHASTDDSCGHAAASSAPQCSPSDRASPLRFSRRRAARATTDAACPCRRALYQIHPIRHTPHPSFASARWCPCERETDARARDMRASALTFGTRRWRRRGARRRHAERGRAAKGQTVGSGGTARSRVCATGGDRNVYTDRRQAHPLILSTCSSEAVMPLSWPSAG